MKRKIFVGIIAMVLGLVLMINPNVNAVSNPEGLTSVTQTFTFQKLVHTNYSDPTNLPAFSFDFTKNAVTGTPAGGDVQNTVANMPAIASVSTTSNWATASQEDTNADFTTSVIQNVAASVTFTEVGTYTYLITENSTAALRNVTYDNTQYKVTFDVAKKDSNNDGEYDALEVAAVVIINVSDNNRKVEAIKFVNEVEPFADVYVVKEVTGAKGDTTKYFDFDVTLTDEGNHNYVIEELRNGTWTALTGSGATGTIVGGTPKTISLKHNQRIHVSGVLVGTNYTVVESNNSNYTTYIKFAGIANVTTGTRADNVLVKETENEVKFINNREDIIDIDTGAIVNVLPYIVVVSIAIFGMIILAKNKSKDDEEV